MHIFACTKAFYRQQFETRTTVSNKSYMETARLSQLIPLQIRVVFAELLTNAPFLSTFFHLRCLSSLTNEYLGMRFSNVATAAVCLLAAASQVRL